MLILDEICYRATPNMIHCWPSLISSILSVFHWIIPVVFCSERRNRIYGISKWQLSHTFFIVAHKPVLQNLGIDIFQPLKWMISRNVFTVSRIWLYSFSFTFHKSAKCTEICFSSTVLAKSTFFFQKQISPSINNYSR